MRVYSRRDFSWKDNKLYLDKTYIGKVFEGEDSVWWIQWADKQISADYYNLTRAKENLVKITMKELNILDDPQDDQETHLGSSVVSLNQ